MTDNGEVEGNGIGILDNKLIVTLSELGRRHRSAFTEALPFVDAARPDQNCRTLPSTSTERHTSYNIRIVLFFALPGRSISLLTRETIRSNEGNEWYRLSDDSSQPPGAPWNAAARDA